MNVPFPSAAEGAKTTSSGPGMSIEIPSRGSSSASSSEERKEQQHGIGTTASSGGSASHPNITTAAGRSFHHHPRQPGPSSEGYFSGSLSSSTSSGAPPRTPGQQSYRGHSRNVSQSSAISALSKSHPMTSSLSGPGAAQPPPSAMPDWGAHSGDWHGGAAGGLPSPSTLTDILLGLHSTLYGAKRSPEEIREMVWRYYDADAAFESPLLAAKGREQVANQFIMAFALPGMDVTSELRDVICSDFEFDGTRAGIIDQTISVTFLPSIFGSDDSVPPSAAGNSRDLSGHHSHSAHPAGITPHPFADYRTPGASAFGHAQHSPVTPFTLSSLWAGGSSRPHTPGGGGGGASSMRPFTTPAPRQDSGGSLDEDTNHGLPPSTVFASAEQTGGGSVSRLKMPTDAVTPHWAHEGGLGRGTVANLLWGLFHPRAMLKRLCTINLRLMSRLEFNDAGHIVRHEDTWGVRETIEGTIPFASLLYALERRVVGYITSWAVDKGFSLSAALHHRGALTNQPHGTDARGDEVALYDRKDHDFTANDAAHALLGRTPRGSTFMQHENFQTISRSRAPSPTRFGWGGSQSHSGTPYVTGTRSRARSSASLYGSRAASSDNLVGMASSGGGGSMPYFGTATGYERGADKELPPDSSARYRGALNKRLDGGRSNSITSAPPHELAGSAFASDDFVRKERDSSVP
ncbi:hypothetical protein BDZ90DRAFT_229600 [Jaminaea rosea]|uniref:Uncharacterized protein n=1 Tax=Jaminaea rosea TaxID=1569628 RepID=A0A316V5A2_9BASI|nr:hypothetical protein BDZ90DRAFT_229600 [Jaminaea rosea]PWN30585.1 hypothetical protein BDZ90DRAFT_229600 [Jaminaea rosea]